MNGHHKRITIGVEIEAYSLVAGDYPFGRRLGRARTSAGTRVRTGRRRPRATPRRRGAMTLTEALVVGLVLTIALAIAALAIAGIRGDLKRRQAWELLATLDKALTAYYRQTGEWPANAATAASAPARWIVPPNRAGERGDPAPSEVMADRVIAILDSVPASQELLNRIPPVLQTHQGGQRRLQDPWGRRLRCLTLASPAAVDFQAVLANGNRPIFISAGENGRSAGATPAEVADDLRSDELPR